MKSHWTITLLLGCLLGVILTFFGRQAPAQGEPKDKEPQWEYKVVFASSATYVEKTKAFDTAAERMTADFNLLAADGWECVRPIVQHYQSTTTVGALVLFRRAKK